MFSVGCVFDSVDFVIHRLICGKDGVQMKIFIIRCVCCVQQTYQHGILTVKSEVILDFRHASDNKGMSIHTHIPRIPNGHFFFFRDFVSHETRDMCVRNNTRLWKMTPFMCCSIGDSPKTHGNECDTVNLLTGEKWIYAEKLMHFKLSKWIWLRSCRRKSPSKCAVAGAILHNIIYAHVLSLPSEQWMQIRL